MSRSHLAVVTLALACATCQQVPGRPGVRPPVGLDAEIQLASSWAAGSPVAARLKVFEAQDLDSLDPSAGAQVTISYENRGRTCRLFQGRTNARGDVVARFRAPSRPGRHPVKIEVSKDGVTREIEQEVEISGEIRVLLSTDKPLYQPGQTIHIRAMALRAMDLVPSRGEMITIEVEDGRGNRVFRDESAASRHGIVSADFQLAEMVNLGEYRIRAKRGDREAAERTVAVQRYVLPKFRVDVDGLRSFYRPGERVEGTVRAEYFFGKKVSRAGVCVLAKTFDVEMHEVARTWGRTNEDGALPFEIELPDTFAGTPLDQGDARVFLEVSVRDRAEHTERKTVSFPVVANALRVDVLPESGRVVPAVENEIFAVATYGDGRPAPRVQVEAAFPGGTQRAETNDLGIAVLRWRPSGGLRAFPSLPEGHPCRNRAGYPVTISAEDPAGERYSGMRCLGAPESHGRVLLRTDQAIYRAGGTMQVTVLGPGTGDAYLDVVKQGQTVLTAILERQRDGGVEPYNLEIPPDLFGSLELHAYRLQQDGNWARDGKVVQVDAPDDLSIDVRPDHGTYRPGQEARIRFRVTDADGAPAPAALGLILVDESVYALQDNQPGLERVFFMLEEEILRPRYAIYGPQGMTFAAVVLDEDRQRIELEAARVLLANANVPDRPRQLARDPAAERARFRREVVPQLLRTAVTHLMDNPDDLVREGRRFVFRTGLQNRWVADGAVTAQQLVDPLGVPVTLDSLARFDREFTPEKVASEAARTRLFEILMVLSRFQGIAQGADRRLLLDRVVEQGRYPPQKLSDPWGGRFVWRRGTRFRHPDLPRGFELASPGPNGRLGDGDDIANPWTRVFRGRGILQSMFDTAPRIMDKQWRDEERRYAAMQRRYRNGTRLPRIRAGASGIGMGGGLMGRSSGSGGMSYDFADDAVGGALARPNGPSRPAPAGAAEAAARPATDRRAGEAVISRIREYFPETLLWRPEVVTNDQGEAEVTLQMADSITTWRMTATANSTSGLLGSTTAGIRAFQDFFVDLDLPVALTQDDRISVPVAVYNYLERPQHVRLAIERERWFDLVGDEEQELDLQPGEVTVRYFPIRAKRVGNFRLGVFAYGERMSDAIRKPVNVEPNGRMEEVAMSDRLGREAERVVEIPETAIAGSQRVLVKLYPGVVSQVMENMDALLRVPYG